MSLAGNLTNKACNNCVYTDCAYDARKSASQIGMVVLTPTPQNGIILCPHNVV